MSCPWEMQSTGTISAQHKVELSLMHFLKKYNPQAHSIWRSHPDLPHETQVLRPSSDDESECDDPDEGRIGSWMRRQASPDFNAPIPLLRRFHADYLSWQLGGLPAGVQGLYPSRPWLAYWTLHAADVLGLVPTLLAQTPAEGLVELLLSCLVLADDGAAAAEKHRRRKPVVGFAGGPSEQLAHLISSYAAVSALVILHDHFPCLHRLPRAAIKRWLLQLRTDEGGFCVHTGGESDIRGSYAAAVIVTLLRLDEPATFPSNSSGRDGEGELDGGRGNDWASVYGRLGVSEENGFDLSGCDDVSATPVLTAATARHVAAQQTYEGGFTCASYATEAHGAYTQCGLAALLLMKQPHLVAQPPLRRWLAERQLAFEGGFNGRTNKLVDSCYSHWVGSSHVMLRVVESHCRLLGADVAKRAAAASPAQLEPLDEEAADAPMLAKDLCLLDHAQIVDATLVSCADEAGWDAAEAAEREKERLVGDFLAAEDAPMRATDARWDTHIRLYSRLHKQEIMEREGLPWTDDTVAKELEKIKRDVRFALEPVGDIAYCNQRKLQQYILRSCQGWRDGEGGLVDKPGCNCDAYHTCYSLSGLSSMQNLQYSRFAAESSRTPFIRRAMERGYIPGRGENYGAVVGVEGPSAGAEVSLVRSTNPMMNVNRRRAVNAMSTWGVKQFI